MAAAGFVLPDLGPTMGVAYIGSILAATYVLLEQHQFEVDRVRSLYGITCIQTFNYFRSGQKDTLLIRSLVSHISYAFILPLLNHDIQVSVLLYGSSF